jgi:hypothetical protein
VPLWVVFGAGGAFIGVIIQEVNKQAPPSLPNSPAEKVIEGEVLERTTDVPKRA